jgi:transcriptional regulator with XRE-family HTH domain
MKRLKTKKGVVSRGKMNGSAQAARLAVSGAQEIPEERVLRLYDADGGPLMGWLLDETRRRGITLQAMASELGVTYGYVAQLRSGIRKCSQISKGFAAACAAYLGAPTSTVLILSGYLTISDFTVQNESEEEIVERALRKMSDDPQFRSAVFSTDLEGLSFEAKRALAMLYAEVAGQDVFSMRQLPEVLRWLQRAAVVHDQNAFAAAAGHRDTSVRLA